MRRVVFCDSAVFETESETWGTHDVAVLPRFVEELSEIVNRHQTDFPVLEAVCDVVGVAARGDVGIHPAAAGQLIGALGSAILKLVEENGFGIEERALLAFEAISATARAVVPGGAISHFDISTGKMASAMESFVADGRARLLAAAIETLGDCAARSEEPLPADVATAVVSVTTMFPEFELSAMRLFSRTTELPVPVARFCVDRAVAALAKTPNDAAITALQLLAAIAVDNTVNAEAVRLDCISAVNSAIDRSIHDGPILVEGLRFLKAIGSSQLATDHGPAAVRQALLIMDSNPDDDVVTVAGIAAFKGFAFNADLQREVIEVGWPARLASLLRERARSEKVLSAALDMVRAVFQRSEDEIAGALSASSIERAIFAAGEAVGTINAWTKCLDTARVIAASFGALMFPGQVASADLGFCATAAKKVMESFPESLAIHELCCAVIGSAGQIYREQSFLQQMTAAIVAAFRRFPEHPTAPCTALWQLGRTPEGSRYLGESGAIRLVVESMSPQSGEDVLISQLRTLLSATVAAENSAEMRDLKVMSLAMAQISRSSLVKVSCASIVWNCCLMDQNREEAIRSGVLEQVISAIRENQSLDVRRTGTGALWVLCASDDRARETALGSGIVEVVDMCLPQFGKLLRDSLTRTEHEALIVAREKNTCVNNTMTFCESPCSARLRYFCADCCPVGHWQSCVTCFGHGGARFLCSTCCSAHHVGHELTTPVFIPGICSCDEPGCKRHW